MQVESIETPMPSRVLPRPVNVAHSPSRAGSPIDAPQYGPVTWGLRTESESTSIADPSIQAPYPRFGVFHQGVRNQSVSGPAGPTRAQPFLQSFAQPFTSATQSSVPPQSYNFERIPSSVPRQSYPGAGEQINIASSAPPQSYPGAAQQINTRPAAPPQSNSRAVQQTNTAASTPFQGDPAVPEQMTVFHNVTARTAKCDVCGERNTVGMTRCSQCGWQTCHPCTRAKGYTRRHGIAGAEHFNQIAEANLIPFFTPKNKGNRARKPTVKKNQQSGHKNASKGETQTQQESQTAPPTSARPPVTSERHPAKPAFNTHCNIGRGKRTASRRKSQQKTTAAKGGNAGGKATLPTSSFTDMRVTEASAQGTMPAFSVGRAGRGSSRYSPGINAFATNTTPAAAIGAASHDSSRRNPRPHPPAQNITPAPAIDAASADASSSNRRPTPPASFTTPAVEVYGATYNSVSNNTAPNTLPAMRNMRVPEAVPQDELEGARILCAISGMAFQGDVERRTRIAAELNARPQPQPPTSLANRNADRSRATRGLRFANSEDTESEGFKDKTDSEYDEDSDMESSPSDTIAQRTKRRRLSKG